MLCAALCLHTKLPGCICTFVASQHPCSLLLCTGKPATQPARCLWADDSNNSHCPSGLHQLRQASGSRQVRKLWRATSAAGRQQTLQLQMRHPVAATGTWKPIGMEALSKELPWLQICATLGEVPGHGRPRRRPAVTQCAGASPRVMSTDQGLALDLVWRRQGREVEFLRNDTLVSTAQLLARSAEAGEPAVALGLLSSRICCACQQSAFSGKMGRMYSTAGVAR